MMAQFLSFLGFGPKDKEKEKRQKTKDKNHKKMSTADEKKGGGGGGGGDASWVMTVNSEKEFDELLKKNDKVVIKFGTPTCKPCKAIAPHLEKLAERHSSKLVAANVHPEELESLAERYDVERWPMFLFFKKGQQIKELSYQGANPDTLQSKIDTFLL
jgi:thioredoxin 1